eukprot:4480635-Alexandrium_andersonii.AAC.1
MNTRVRTEGCAHTIALMHDRWARPSFGHAPVRVGCDTDVVLVVAGVENVDRMTVVVAVDVAVVVVVGVVVVVIVVVEAVVVVVVGAGVGVGVVGGR